MIGLLYAATYVVEALGFLGIVVGLVLLVTTQTRAAGVNATRPAHASTNRGGTEGRQLVAPGRARPRPFFVAGVPAPAARTTAPTSTACTTDWRTR